MGRSDRARGARMADIEMTSVERVPIPCPTLTTSGHVELLHGFGYGASRRSLTIHRCAPANERSPAHTSRFRRFSTVSSSAAV